MSRYIDAEWEEKYWTKCLHHPTPDVTENDIKHAGAIIDALRMAKTADVKEVVHGKWINGNCNQCGEHAPFWAMASTYYQSNFCPHCGADMRGGKDERTD